MRAIIAIFVTFFVLPSTGLANVFGTDRRVEAPVTESPFNKIGKLFIDGQSAEQNCTASLVGRDKILTNMHCVAKLLAKFAKGNLYFKAGYKKRTQVSSTWVKHISGNYKLTDTGIAWERHQDFAILTLSAPLGDYLGWFKVAPSSLPFIGSEVMLAGYSSDLFKGEVMTVDYSCKLMEVSPIGILHDCHMAKGSSGAPILKLINGEYVIVALNSGFYPAEPNVRLHKRDFYSRDYANLAMETSQFQNLIEKN